MEKVNFKAEYEADIAKNYSQLQEALSKLKVQSV
jgi:hypothetical protein